MSANPTADSQAMPKVIVDRFCQDDLDLLKTGLYSDAQVSAGDQVWDVHKSIVGQRSAYMGEEFFRLPDEEDPSPVRLPFDTTEREAELLLEFLYSGSIANIDKLSLEDCVVLSILGENFHVESMITYAEVKLWDKLRTRLQHKPPGLSRADSTQPPRSPTNDFIRGILRLNSSSDLAFVYQFELAVDKAYSYQAKACKLILADFVWAARSWMLGSSLLELLNRSHYKFGRDILTTLNQGPQTRFLRSAQPLRNSAFCTKCVQQQDDEMSQALQLYEPEPESP